MRTAALCRAELHPGMPITAHHDIESERKELIALE